MADERDADYAAAIGCRQPIVISVAERLVFAPARTKANEQICLAQKNASSTEDSMKREHAKFLAIGVLMMMGTGGLASAADKTLKADLGKREYENSCALCHGKDGKGTGAINDLLKKSPTDLTTLAKKNNGVFPFDRVYAVVDGREVVKGHGDRDMPAWGDRYSSDSVKAAEYYMDVPYDAEMYARSRILSLIDYLNRIQVK